MGGLVGFFNFFRRNGQRDAVLVADSDTLTDAGTITKGEVISLTTLVPPTTISVFQAGAFTGAITTEALVWSQGGAYVYLTVAGVVSVQSDNAGDTGQTVVVTGLVDGEPLTELVTSNGTTPVNTVALFTRIFTGANVAGPDTLGTMTIEGTGADAGTVLASWGATNISSQCLYTAPDTGKTYLTQVSVATGKNDEVEFILYTRAPGGNWLGGGRGISYQQASIVALTYPSTTGYGVELPPGVDFEFRAKRITGAATSEVGCSVLITRVTA